MELMVCYHFVCPVEAKFHVESQSQGGINGLGHMTKIIAVMPIYDK